MTRTYTRADLQAARDAWDAGDFSREWRDVRHKAAMGGIIYPPEGAKWDSWGEDAPSQRAILIRAIRETPKLLDRCLTGASSWSQVIERLFAARDEWREQAEQADREAQRRKLDDGPDEREATMVLKSILTRIGDS